MENLTREAHARNLSATLAVKPAWVFENTSAGNYAEALLNASDGGVLMDYFDDPRIIHVYAEAFLGTCRNLSRECEVGFETGWKNAPAENTFWEEIRACPNTFFEVASAYVNGRIAVHDFSQYYEALYGTPPYDPDGEYSEGPAQCPVSVIRGIAKATKVEAPIQLTQKLGDP